MPDLHIRRQIRRHSLPQPERHRHVAQLLHAPQAKVDVLALVFVAARVCYIGCYVADLAKLRSLCWFVGIGSAIAIFVAGA